MEMQHDKKEMLITRDWLAIERTRLANERTFLAYMRTAIVLVASGLTIVKLELFSSIVELGYFLLGFGPVFFLFGLYRFIKVSREIKKYYDFETRGK